MLTLRADGTIVLDGDDAESLYLVDQKCTGTYRAAATDVNETLIYNNITVGQACIVTGNV